MEKWFIKNREGDFRKIARDFQVSELMAKLLVNRGITDYRLISSYLRPDLDKLHNPSLLKDLDKSVEILRNKILEEKRIRIVGDYDVDGVISIYLLYISIKKLGGLVDYVIPNRVDEGYGINKSIVETAEKEGVDTIITCDNGIAAINEVELAKRLGMTIIVTDHHEPVLMTDDGGGIRQNLPKADGIINPKQLDCNYPFKGLCGAAVVFKLIEGLYKSFNYPEESIYPLLEYAAIATVCDVVDLVDENRIIVKSGLELLNNTNNIGLRALIKETGIEEKKIGVYHLGFILGPTINASGRLDTALKALDLLLSNDMDQAIALARELRELNEERKAMTSQSFENIVKLIEEDQLNRDKVLVVYDPNTHESIAGIVASRVKEKYNKPTIVLTQGKDGVKGSARSIEEYNMFEELSKCKDILSRFGGHPMAAGVSLELDRIRDLRENLNKHTSLTDEDIIRKVYIDMQLPLEYISFKLLKELETLEPFGKGNSKPIFGEKGLKISKGFILGKNKNVIKLILESRSKKRLEGLYFGDAVKFQERVIDIYGDEGLNNMFQGRANDIEIDILYHPSVNEYNGNISLQVIIESYRFKEL